MTIEDIKDRALGLIFSELPSDSVGGNIRDYVIFEKYVELNESYFLCDNFDICEDYEDYTSMEVNELYEDLTEFGVEIMNDTANDVLKEINGDKG